MKMPRTKKVGPVARFGARAGVSLRKKRAKVEITLKQFYECPHCLSKTVWRHSVGIWKCRKCGYTFAGGAYTPTTKIGETARSVKALSAAKK